MHSHTNRIQHLIDSDDLTELAAWKREMVEAADFGAAYHSFLTRFGEMDHFFRMGRPTKEPLLSSIVQDLASHVLGRPVRIRYSRLLEIPSQQFVHGVLDLDGNCAHVVFFRDIFSGLLAISTRGFSDSLLILRVTGRLGSNTDPTDVSGD